MKNQKQTIRNLFTLIELLVVIAILLLIISLASPAIKSTIRTANNLACATNLKSIGLLFEQFAEDNNFSYLDNEILFKKNEFGDFKYTIPNIRRSYKTWPRSLEVYDEAMNSIIYCPEDDSEDALLKNTNNNAQASYEFKHILISLSRTTFNNSVRTDQFEMPSRQSLLGSKRTYHHDIVRGNNDPHDTFIQKNMYFVDGHVSIDYSGYNHPNIIGPTVNWRYYPVYRDNTKATGDENYLETRCEVDENAL